MLLKSAWEWGKGRYELANENPWVKYRKPYTTRKTAITLSLKSGASYIEVAAAAGHDPQTMHKYYADVIQDRSVFIS